MNETMTTLLNRRCIRAFKAEQITDDELNAVLEAGKYAPSGANQQSALFIVVQDRDTRETLSQMNRAVNGGDSDPYYGAPTVVLVLADTSQGHSGRRRQPRFGQHVQRRALARPGLVLGPS